MSHDDLLPTNGVFRSVYLDPIVDRGYQEVAYINGISKTELYRLFINFGLLILRKEASKNGMLDIDEIKFKLQRITDEYGKNDI